MSLKKVAFKYRSAKGSSVWSAIFLLTCLSLGCEKDESHQDEAAVSETVDPTNSTVVSTNPNKSTDSGPTTTTGGPVGTNDNVEQSSVAAVTSVEISGTDISPQFDQATTTYTAHVRNGVSSIVLNVGFSDEKAVLTINNQPRMNSYELNVGINVFSIVLKSEDLSVTQTYQLNVQRSRQYAYVTNVDTASPNDTLSLYSINPDSGVLEPLSNASVTVGDDPYDLSASPDGRHLYVSNSLSDTVSMFSIAKETGLLTPLSPATVNQSSVPYSIAFVPAGNFMYSANGDGANPGTIAQYSRNTESGMISSLNPATATSFINPWFLAIEPKGKYLYVTQFGAFGSAANDTVQQYEINETTGVLSAMTPFTVAAENMPWYIVVHPSGKFAYVGNYGSSSVSQYSINQNDGTLSPLIPATISVGNQPVGLAIDPLGRFLYVANSSSNSLHMFSIDADTGTLSSIGVGSIAIADAPYGLMIDKTSRFLYVAKSASSSVAIFNIDQTTGALTANTTASVSAGTNPRFIVIVD